MSDTSEAPSLASHVRRVRVPSQASDVDQFLDDLFMPVLDGNLDELSDARSLAASIRGTFDESEIPSKRNEKSSEVNSVDDFVQAMISSYDKKELKLTSKTLSEKIKGDGNMDNANQNAAFNFNALAHGMMPPAMMMPMFSPPAPVSPGQNQNMNSMNMSSGFMPIPIYNMQGLNLHQFSNSPPNQNSDMMAYQQNLQRAFLQRAMAQNIQIQQQILAQNQALHQLLVQSPQNASQTVRLKI